MVSTPPIRWLLEEFLVLSTKTEGMENNDMRQLQFDPQDYAVFCAKPKEEQIHELLALGMHLDTMFDNNYKTLLFFIRGFFVEVCISRHADRVVDILVIKDGYKIDQYIHQIQNHYKVNSIVF